jgi:hypothetical protein
VRLSTHDVGTSLVEAVLARGGVEAAALVHEAWRRGARFDGWSEHFSLETWQAAAHCVEMELEEAARTEPASSPIDPLLDEAFLSSEQERAAAGVRTQDCRTGACTSCGVCGGPVRMDLRPSAIVQSVGSGL